MEHTVMFQAVFNPVLIPSRSVIEDAAEKKDILSRLGKAWGVSNNRASTGAQPVSMSRKMLKDMDRDAYLVGLKSDGVRYTLFMCMKDGIPLAVMIDRSHNMYEVEIMATEDHFHLETVMEGELVWKLPDKRHMLFILFDAVRIKGKLLAKFPFHERLNAASRCVDLSEDLALLDVNEAEARVSETDTLLITSISPSIVLSAKRFVSMTHAAAIWNNRGDTHHIVDGLILQNRDAPYRNGTAKGVVIKWKPEHTIDLKGPVDGLSCADGPLSSALFGGRDIVIGNTKILHLDDIVEYHIDAHDPSRVILRGIRKRPDKTHANSLCVVKATFNDCIENILPEEISGV